MRKAILLLLLLTWSFNVSAQNGTIKWKFKTDGSVFSAPTIGPDGTIYIKSSDKYLYAIKPDGSLKWKVLYKVSSAPVIGPFGIIYIGCQEGYLRAINPDDGTLVWELKSGESFDSTPAIGADGTIYIGNYDENLYAINPNGTIKWKYKTIGPIYASPSVDADGTIYFASYDDDLYSLHPDGTLNWQVFVGVGSTSTVIGPDSTLFVAEDSRHYIYAINKKDGTIKWSFKTNDGNYVAPVIGADSTLYFGSWDTYFYAIDLNGTFKWKYKTKNYIRCTPAIGANGTIYFSTGEGYFTALNPNGKLQWRYNTNGFMDSPPAIGADGTVYVGDRAGYLYAFNTDCGGLAKTLWPMYGNNPQHTGNPTLELFAKADINVADIDAQDQVGGTLDFYSYKDCQINACQFENTGFQFTDAVNFALQANNTKSLAFTVDADSSGMYSSDCLISYTINGEEKQTTVKVQIGALVDDQSDHYHSIVKARDMYNNTTGLAQRNNLGVLYTLLGDIHNGYSTLQAAEEQALNEGFGYQGVRLNRGIVSSELDEPVLANMYFDYVLNEGTVLRAQVYYNKAWYSYQTANYELTIAQCDSALLEESNEYLHAKIHTLRGAAATYLGDFADAQNEFQLAVALDPDGPVGELAQYNASLQFNFGKVALSTNWNLVSLPWMYLDDAPATVLSSILPNVKIVLGYNQGGETFDPAHIPESNLESISYFNGYWIKMDNADTLDVTGVTMDYRQTVISLSEGWNLVGYLPELPDLCSHAFADILDKIEIVMGFDGAGQTFVPGMDLFNTLDILEPYMGYWVKVKEAVEFTYPDPIVNQSMIAKRLRTFGDKQSQMNTSIQMLHPTHEWVNVYARKIMWEGEKLAVGSEIKLVDVAGNICGLGKVTTAGQFGFIPVYSDDKTSSDLDEGGTVGEMIALYINNIFAGDFIYPEKGTLLDLTDLSTDINQPLALPDKTELLQNYPNPFNPTTTISYNVSARDDIRMQIYNIHGEHITTLVDQVQECGRYKVIWDGLNNSGLKVAAGVYFCRLQAGGTLVQTTKLILVK